MNIFWQTVLSYIYVYVKLFHDNNMANLIIEALRHWVFVGINYKDTPSFNGKFIKTITNDNTDITYISYWFLANHHHGSIQPMYTCPHMVSNAHSEEFEVTQGECGHLINEVYKYCTETPKSTPRSKIFLKKNLFKAILDAFPFSNTDINHDMNQIIIGIGEVLKFSGDMSHKTAALIYKNVFKGTKFKQFTPCVTTIDRPLFVSFFMDNIPGIISNPNTSILELSGITAKFGHTVSSLRSQNKTLVSFYLPTLELEIFDLLEKYITILNGYIGLLNSYYDPIYDNFFLTEYKYRKKRDDDANNTLNIIYQYLTYISMFYLSLFSSNICNTALLQGAFNSFDIKDIDHSLLTYHFRYVPDYRINYAWFAYYYSKIKFSDINYDNLNDHKFIGVTQIPVHHEIIQSFFKNHPIIFNTNLTNAPQTVKDLSTLLQSHSYPNIFEIKDPKYLTGMLNFSDGLKIQQNKNDN
jgi:hypothetical protein